MPSPQSEPIVTEMRHILKTLRLETNKESLRQWSAAHNLDPSMVSRLENPEKDSRIPSITFWIDYCLALDCDLGKIQREAMQNLKKSGDQK